MGHTLCQKNPKTSREIYDCMTANYYKIISAALRSDPLRVSSNATS